MKKTTFIALVGVLSLFLSSCKKEAEATAPPPPEFDMAAAKASIESGYREFEAAFNAKDAVALSNSYASDAKFMQPNDKSVEGKANIQAFFAEWFKGETPKIACKVVELWGDEKNVIAENSWTMTMNGKVVDEGKSIEVYKMEDGKWKLLRDCYNSNMPAIPPTPPAR